MSLNRSERAATRDELRANLDLSGLTANEVAAGIGLEIERVRDALEVAGARPADVWLVRDYLDREVRAAGAVPKPYSSLTENMRASAQAWFAIADVDEVAARSGREV